MKNKISRRKFLAACGITGLGTAGYMRCWEPDWLQVGRHHVPLGAARLPTVRLLHMSDMHASRVVSLEQISEAVQLGLSLKPHVGCLTGDFITSKYDRLPEFTKVLKPLAEAVPTFACLGNHDGGPWIAWRGYGYADTSKIEGMLRAANITVLRNESAEITANGRTLQFVGVGDMWAKDLNARKAFAGVQKSSDRSIVLLSHNPDSKTRVQDYPWDLMLCGHTHGGQLWIPLLGAPFAPVRDKRFVKGLVPWRGRWVHVTKGVGNLHGIRLNCPPEVSLLTLV